MPCDSTHTRTPTCPTAEPTSPPTPFDVVPEGAYLTRAHQYHLLLINPGGHQQHDYTAAN
jgi:hypothetical protein